MGCCRNVAVCQHSIYLLLDAKQDFSPLYKFIRTCQICSSGDHETDEAAAMADFAAAEKLDPQNSDVFHHRGQLSLLLDRTLDACQDFDKCVSLQPQFALAQVQNAYTQYR